MPHDISLKITDTQYGDVSSSTWVACPVARNQRVGVQLVSLKVVDLLSCTQQVGFPLRSCTELFLYNQLTGF